MTTITKKYIFKCKLADKPIVVSVMSHQDFADAVKILCRYKILSRTNRAMKDTIAKEYQILYNIKINNWAGPGIIIKYYHSYFSNEYVLRYEDIHNLIPNEYYN